MAETPVIVFDDGRAQLGPVTDLRAVFEVRTGELTTAERIAREFGRVAGYQIPDRLAALVGERVGAPVNHIPDARSLMMINGRWAIPSRDLAPQPGEAIVDSESGDLIAADVFHADAADFLNNGRLPDRVARREVTDAGLICHPWDILRLMKQTIAADILAGRMLDAKVLEFGASVVGHHPVSVDRTARIYPGVVLDAENGPIAIHERAVIRPNAVICGPCSIGRDSVVIDHALIKANTAIGPMCKVGGEVGATIFQGYSNKSHDGHLGDSWVGKWVNFGAGTTNSNLLNTYGEIVVRVDPDGPRMRTGMNFLGAIIGDHVKMAINTRLMTGTMIATGAMIATTAPVPTTVKRFAWLTDDGERVYRFDKFLEVAKTVLARRDQILSESYINSLRQLHVRSTSSKS